MLARAMGAGAADTLTGAAAEPVFDGPSVEVGEPFRPCQRALRLKITDGSNRLPAENRLLGWRVNSSNTHADFSRRGCDGGGVVFRV
jgi:hypothetical protein